MSLPKITKAMNQIDDHLVSDAVTYQRTKGKTIWLKWGAMAACVCLVAVGGAMLLQHGGQSAPKPEIVQVTSPIIGVGSVEEMEKYLDFQVPVLEKAVAQYVVLVEDKYPTIGQVTYIDGSEFRIRYGSGDISGIYGGTQVESREIDGVTVKYYQLADAEYSTTYAIWEQNGFTFSYIYTEENEAEIQSLIKAYQ